MARPGGNPNLKYHGFSTDRAEPLVRQVNVRMSDSMAREIKSRENWNEFVRQAVAEKLEREKKSESIKK